MQAMAHLFLGHFVPSFQLWRKGKSLSHLQEAVKLQPRLAVAHFAYASELQEEHKVSQAKSFYQKGIALGSGDLKERAQKEVKQLSNMK